MTTDAPGDPVPSDPAAPDQAAGKRRWRVGFYVEVEVDAWPQEAHLIAEAACGFPGDWRPPREPVAVEGPFDGGRIQAKALIVRSQALMVKETDRA